ncbi:hypothetical protein [Vogesella indigofera]|nr:hypothetical protein [Vogesella indigofera]MDC7700910.1 hypothetical protein [Vogesella indigofera]
MTTPLKIGLSARIYHPQPGAAHLLDCTPVLDRFLLRARERSRR